MAACAPIFSVAPGIDHAAILLPLQYMHVEQRSVAAPQPGRFVSSTMLRTVC